MKQRSIATTAGLALILALSACGGSDKPNQGFAGPIFPAATLLTDEQAEQFVRAPAPVQASSTPSVVAVAPTSFAGTQRQIGPPGNPSAATLSDPPASGLYGYKITVQGDFGEESSEFAVSVEEPRTVRGGTTQTHEWQIEDFPQVFHYRFTSQRLLLERVESTQFDGSQYDCEFDPPQVELQLPLHVDASWSGTSACKGDDTTSGEYSAEVIRTERVEIAGTQVDTFVVRTETTTSDGSETIETAWYAPTVRMFVILDQEVHTATFGSFKSTVEATSLTPTEG